jgi:hypothetical protein
MRTRDWCYSYSNGIVPATMQMLVVENQVENIETLPVAENKVKEQVTITEKLPVNGNSAEQTSIDGAKTAVVDYGRSTGGTTSAGSDISNILSPLADMFRRKTTKPVPTYRAKTAARYHGSPYNRKTPACDDRDDRYNICRFSSVPESQLVANGLNVTMVREFERVSHRFTEYVNSVDGYVSDCALVYQKAGRYVSMTDEAMSVHRAKRQRLVKAGKEYMRLVDLEKKSVV